MSVKYLKTHILLRRGPLHEWETVNPILGPGQMGVALDIGRCKIGNGISHWNELPFFVIMPDLVDYAKVVIKTYSQWRNSAYEISTKGQIYVYLKENNDEENNFLVDIKIGDGKTYIVDLPFLMDPIKSLQDLLNAHIHNTNIHTSAEQKAFWNNKLNIEDNNEHIIDNNTLIFNRN